MKCPSKCAAAAAATVAAMLGCIGNNGIGTARADTLVYSFETLYNDSGTIDMAGTRPDRFHENPVGLPSTIITQDTIGATNGTHSMKYAMTTGAFFTGAQTELLPAPLFASTSYAASFDLTVPATGNFSGAFARIGVSAFGDDHPQPPTMPTNRQVQAVSAAEQNIFLEPGTYHITLPFIASFNPADPFGSPFSLPFSSVFGPGSNQLTPTSWELFINKSTDSPLTVYIDNLQVRTRPVSVWSTDTSGTWSEGDGGFGSKWNTLPPATGDNSFIQPNAPDTLVLMSSIAGATAHTTTVDGPKTIGGIDFNGGGTMTIDASGPGVLTFDVTSGQSTINVYRGNHFITAPLVFSDDTTIDVRGAANQLSMTGNVTATGKTITKNGPGLLLVSNVRAGGLVANDGIVRVVADGGNAGTSRLTSSLTIPAGGTFDLADNDLIVGNGTSKAQIETYVRNARNGGNWLEPGLTSSTARDNAAGNTGLGVLSGSEYAGSNGGTTTFDGISFNSTDTIVKYTWNGDANLNGVVNFDDYVKTDVGFNTNLTGWLNGDYNYSGQVNFDDYVMIDVAFNTQSGTLGRAIRYVDGTDRSDNGMSDAVREVVEHLDQFGTPYAQSFLSAVPEPGSLSMLGAAVLGLARRRRSN